MRAEELKALVLTSFEEEHQPGGDIKIDVPATNKVLIGQHDGIYRLRPA